MSFVFSGLFFLQFKAATVSFLSLRLHAARALRAVLFLICRCGGVSEVGQSSFLSLVSESCC